MLRDQLNSASEVLDASGAIVGETRYFPFGDVRVSTGSMFTDRLYTGQRAITRLGLDYYNARYYDPALGRFISPDTVTAGGPQGLNRYSYVLNNPVNFNDPTGQNACAAFVNGMCVHEVSDVDQKLINANGATITSPSSSVVTITPKAPSNSNGNGGKGQDNGPECGIACQAAYQYIQNWGYFGDSWSILNNEEANPLFKAYALTYMFGWGGANLALAGGLAVIGWETIGYPVLLSGLTQLATNNPESQIVSLGSNGAYQEVGDTFGYTYFKLPSIVYNTLDKLGMANDVNAQFITNQMQQAKTFVVTITSENPGPGTLQEMQWITESNFYNQISSAWSSFTHIFTP